MAEHNETITTLNTLIATTIDSVTGYEDSAKNIENDQAGALRKLSERFRLGPGGYEEVPATHFEQRFHGLARADAVPVGLDGRARGHSRTLLEPAPVGLERGAVDGKAQRSMHGLAVTALLGRVEIRLRPLPISSVERLDHEFDRLVEAVGIHAPRLRV